VPIASGFYPASGEAFGQVSGFGVAPKNVAGVRSVTAERFGSSSSCLRGFA